MAFARPTLSDLITRIQADFVSRMALVGAVLRRSMVYVMSRVMAGAVHMLHGHLAYLGDQLFADRSEAEFLLRQGGLFGITPNPAAFATGNVTLTGTSGTVSAGHLLKRSDGAEFSTNADATLSGGVATVAVTALVAAADGNCDVGVSLAFESPVAGVDSTALVASGGLTQGTDVESTADYRTRVLARLQAPPHGGSASDYVAWAREVPGVTRAWCYPQEIGAGTVVVRFMRDNDSGSPIPDSGEVATVQAHIDGVRPVTATTTVSAPTANPLALTLHIVPDTTATRAAVLAELTDLLTRESAPGVTLLLASIRTAIGVAVGLTNYTLTSPSADVTQTTAQIATMGTITYV